MLKEVHITSDERQKAQPTWGRTCAAQGIEVTGKVEGTCRAGGREYAVVSKGTALKLPTYTATNVRVKTARSLTSKFPIINITSAGIERGYETKRAKGMFVVVEAKVRNTGKEPVQFFKPAIVIGSLTAKVHSPISDSDTFVLPTSTSQPFPIKPNRTATVRAVFDIPRAKVKQVLSQGGLLFPAGFGPGLAEYSAALGVVRLGAPPA